MPEVLPNETNEFNIQAREIALVQGHISHYMSHLMPGPATSAGDYQIETGGSLLRARMALASGRAFGSSREFRIAAGAACELIHNASLVHDDLVDRDEIRRGSASVWKRFGDGVALCAGDLLLCAAFGVAGGLQNPVESRLLSQKLTALTGRVIVGQSLELAAAPDSARPSLKAYLQATKAKTVPLIELPLVTGAVAGGVDLSIQHCIHRLASAIGLAYQIIDDLDDLYDSRRELHCFHAWHHHRCGQKSDPQSRVCRATQHAIGALVRGRRLLGQLERSEPGVQKCLSPIINPLLKKLEKRALAHRQHWKTAAEPVSYENVAAG